MSEGRIEKIAVPIENIVATDKDVIKVRNVLINLRTGEITLLNGGRKAHWAKNKAEIGAFIAREGITAVSAAKAQELVQAVNIAPVATNLQAVKTVESVAVSRVTSKNVAELVPQVWWNGGMRSPHLHYDGKIYPLTATQWTKFASSAVEKLSKQLAQAKSISFDRFMDTSEIVEELT